MSVALLIASAGQGRRMGKNIKKQYLKIKSVPLLTRTINSFASCSNFFEQIVLLIPEGDHEYVENNILPGAADDLCSKIELTAGGNSRRETVQKGLEELRTDIDYVVIHDGARPFVKCDLMEEVIEEVKNKKAVTVGTAVKDTIKIQNKSGLVEETLDRDKLIAVQTPQAFSCEIIIKAHNEINKTMRASDDACLVEKLGYKVSVVRGSYDNIKITTPFDLKVAELLLAEKEGERGER